MRSSGLHWRGRGGPRGTALGPTLAGRRVWARTRALGDLRGRRGCSPVWSAARRLPASLPSLLRPPLAWPGGSAPPPASLGPCSTRHVNGVIKHSRACDPGALLGGIKFSGRACSRLKAAWNPQGGPSPHGVLLRPWDRAGSQVCWEGWVVILGAGWGYSRLFSSRDHLCSPCIDALPTLLRSNLIFFFFFFFNRNQ